MLSPNLREAGSAAGSHSKEHNSERISLAVFVFLFLSVFVVVIGVSFPFMVATPRSTIVSAFLSCICFPVWVCVLGVEKRKVYHLYL